MTALPWFRRSKFGSVLTPALLGISCLACCPAWPPNAPEVRIADQEVLIWWDKANGVEHFVRRANFAADELPDDFGFLVPTPTQPTLSETSDDVFGALSYAIRPEIQYRKRYRPNFMPLVLAPLMIGEEMAPTDAAAGGVEVLDVAFVGGFEASVLRASDVDALIAWLEENGYDARAELREWLDPYIAKQWIVTAFKFDCDTETGSRSLSRDAVCLSFATDAPFFPYRVPTDQLVAPEDGSLLRVYFAGPEPTAGHFESGESPWTATTKFSAEVSDAGRLLAGVGDPAAANVDPPEKIWLTTFEDNTWPGGTEDLYFTASEDRSEVRPPPIIRDRTREVWIPSDVVLGLGAIAFFIVRRRRKQG